jgi:3-deoxy-manno-octulosonate cytidylyltransferase (CMP-KDO synthetase)
MAGKALGIIPARWGSTRFPGKPLHVIAGKPLLRHVWERCTRASKLDAVIIATDDMRIAEAAFEWGAEVALTSTRLRSGTDRAAAVAERAAEFRHIINIQGDEPLTDPRLINRLVEKLQSSRGVQMITAAHPFENPADAESPHQVKVVLDQQQQALFFSRSRIPFIREPAAATPLLRHQGIYGYTRDLLLQFVRWKPSPLERAESLEQLRALEHGVKIQVVITTRGHAGIDTPEDARAFEQQL